MSTATPEQHQRAVQAVLDWYHVSGASPDRETISDIVRVALSTVDQPATGQPTPVTVQLPEKGRLVDLLHRHLGVALVLPDGSRVCDCGLAFWDLSPRAGAEHLANHILDFLEANVKVVDAHDADWPYASDEEPQRSVSKERRDIAAGLLLAFADGLHTMANSLADALNTGDSHPAKN